MKAIPEYLSIDDAVLEYHWSQLQKHLEERFGQNPGIEAILFLIGIQSRGHGYQPKLKKEAKQDLIMEGTYCAFEKVGLYRRVPEPDDSGEQWLRTSVVIPELTVDEQEKLLRIAILKYFDEI